MYEILSAFQLINLQCTKKFISLHLCEARGAFVSATNHYFMGLRKQSEENIEWDWVACTLNPHFEGNDQRHLTGDDALITETVVHWYFGADNTGDMRLRPNIEGAWEKMKSKGPVMLVTADGCMGGAASGQACAMDAQLQFCQVVTAMGALSKGGNLVMRMASLCDHASLCLVYLVSCVFARTSVCKPTTSASTSSETFLVCEHFEGIAEDYLQALL
ncbi:hypothetical protein GUITHDRAFT_72655, partial [Guillardia theta CCMP2712]